MQPNGYDEGETDHDVDDVVALATDPRTAFVYWELTAARSERSRQADPDGQLVLRVVTVAPSGVDTNRTRRDIPIDQLVGDRFISGLEPGCELRMCLGWSGSNGFVPLVVGPDIRMPRAVAGSPASGLTDPELAREALRTAAREVCGSGKNRARYRDYLARVRQGEEPNKAWIASVPPPPPQ